jgi:hypothetical protein
MKTAGLHCPATEHPVRVVRTDPAQSSGCEARKRPAVGEVFFLDFYLYRTYRELKSLAAFLVMQLLWVYAHCVSNMEVTYSSW